MSANPKQFSPRKTPHQERARFTVDNILTGARTIILEKGYEAATTNHIAEVAGVSIGSLYQYFPSKEAIVAALVETAVFEAGESIRKFLIERMGLGLRDSIPEIIQHLMDIRRESGFLIRHLAREVPKFGKVSGQLTTEKYLYSSVRAFYTQHREEIKVKDLDVAMFVVEHLVVGGIDDYLDNAAPQVTEEELVKEISDAVIKYLTK
jgi:AcrR family transcriptional regulator